MSLDYLLGVATPFVLAALVLLAHLYWEFGREYVRCRFCLHTLKPKGLPSTTGDRYAWLHLKTHPLCNQAMADLWDRNGRKPTYNLPKPLPFVRQKPLVQPSGYPKPLTLSDLGLPDRKEADHE